MEKRSSEPAKALKKFSQFHAIKREVLPMIAQLQKVFSRVRAKQREGERDQFQTYWEIVARVAHGESLDDGALVDAALAAGRDSDQMAKDCELYLRRERLARELEAAPAKAREAEKLARLIETKSAELIEIQQRLGGEIGSLYESKKLLEAEAATGQHRSELIASNPNPALRARLDELHARRRELLSQREPLLESARTRSQGSLLGALTSTEQQLEEWSEREGADAKQHAATLRDRLKAYRSRLAELEQQISNLDEQIAAADREAESVRLEMMKP
jgi:chromosome segregation ATPase